MRGEWCASVCSAGGAGALALAVLTLVVLVVLALLLLSVVLCWLIDAPSHCC